MSDVKNQAAQAPASRTQLPLDSVHLDDLLRKSVEKDASDMHLVVGVPPILRVDGQLTAMNYVRVSPQDSQRIAYDIMTDEQIQKFETNFELDFSYSLAKVARFRVNVYKDNGTIAAAFRKIPTKIPTMRDLGLPMVLEELTKKKRGLVLVTGPTGSGKSTTLAAMINAINTERSEHIITIEDPIEYLHTHKYSIINQREIGQDTRSFSNALRSALREDPDVVLVGEMRDLETIQIAITTAETGHLVFATLHTNNAAQTVDRMVDVFPPGQQEQIRFQLSNNLEAVICQQLLPRAGMPGRVCGMEIMICTPAIRNLIRENKAHQIPSAIQTGANVGMQSMDQHLRDLYQKGIITYELALERAMNPDELKKMMSGREGQPAAARPQ